MSRVWILLDRFFRNESNLIRFRTVICFNQEHARASAWFNMIFYISITRYLQTCNKQHLYNDRRNWKNWMEKLVKWNFIVYPSLLFMKVFEINFHNLEFLPGEPNKRNEKFEYLCNIVGKNKAVKNSLASCPVPVTAWMSKSFPPLLEPSDRDPDSISCEKYYKNF